MEYRTLGRTGVKVTQLCLGAMMFGAWGNPDHEESIRIIHRALDAGVNFIDTADVYSNGESETMVGKALAGRRAQVVLATKVRGRMGPGPNQVGLSRLHIIEAVEASLKRLGTDYIDLYQIHRTDSLTNVEDTLRALSDLVRSGKIRYIGCSNHYAWQIMKALAISKSEGLEKFRCTQSYYSLAGRDLEREIIPLIQDQGLGLLVWSPLAGGFLSGKFTKDGVAASGRRATFDFPPVDKERAYAIVEVLRSIGANRGVSAARVAIAWLLTRAAVTSVIIGAKSVEQLDDNLKSGELVLSAEEIASLDTVSQQTPEYPAWMNTLPPDRLPGQERRFERK
jgi:aryl-alcohol dehydrogenase-like predicted oxidoreductase